MKKMIQEKRHVTLSGSLSFSGRFGLKYWIMDSAILAEVKTSLFWLQESASAACR